MVGAVALGLETFTLLAILEARDQASEIYAKVSESLDGFSDTIKGAADTAKTASASIDDSLLKTAGSADALDIASAQVEAAMAAEEIAIRSLAAAEDQLIEARSAAAGSAEADASATTGLIAASKALTDAQEAAAKATKTLGDAQKTQAATQEAVAAKSTESTAAADEESSGWNDVTSVVGKYSKGMTIAGLAVGAAAYESVKAAANFQTMTTVLQTSGGETESMMAGARSGILNLAQSTGTATQELTNGLYTLGSAGFNVAHGGLQALQAAAQGAKAENADLGTVTNALSTVLVDYGVKVTNNAAGQKVANQYMDQMIAIVQNGKTTTEALAGSLQNVLPIASAVGLSFDQVGGAMATMTASGMSADQASQDLANTIRNLNSPSEVASKEMAQMGINSTTLSKNLGKTGLEGTIQEITNAIQQHMGPAGTVVVSAFQNSAAATANLKTIMNSMPSSLKSLADGIVNGTEGTKALTTAEYGLNEGQKNMLSQLVKVVDQTHEFNSALTSGTPAQKTAAAALQQMLGGATGLNTALMLSSGNYKTMTADTKAVAAAGKSASTSVEGWTAVQGTLNQKVDQAKEAIDVTAIKIGTALLPMLTGMLTSIEHILAPIAKFITSHAKLAAVAMVVVGGLSALVLTITAVSKVVKICNSAYQDITKVITGFGKILGLVKKAQADTTETTEADTVAKEENVTATETSTEADSGQLSILDALEEQQAEATAAVEANTVAQEENAGATEESLGMMDGLHAIMGNVSDALSTAKDAAVDFGSKTLSVATSLGSSAWTGAVSVFSKMGSTIGSAAATMGSWIGSAAAATGAAIGQAAAFTASKVAMVATTVATKTATAAQWLFDAAMDANPITLVVIAIIALAAVFYELYEHCTVVRDAINDLWSWLKGAVVDTINFVKAHWQLIIAILGGPIGIVVGLVIKYWGDIKQWFTDGVNAVKSVLNWFAGLGALFGRWLDDAGNAVSSGVGSVVKFFGRLPTDIKNLLADAGTWLLDIGSDIIHGLENGITGEMGNLESKVKNMAGDVVGWAKSALSIFSPSLVMADEVGRFIPSGIAKGVVENAGTLKTAVTQVTASAVGAGRAGITSGPILGAGGAVPANGVVINLDLRNSSVMSDQDMTNLVNKVGRAVATKVLPQAGVRINGRR